MLRVRRLAAVRLAGVNWRLKSGAFTSPHFARNLALHL